jgi:hypothetical protein
MPRLLLPLLVCLLLLAPAAHAADPSGPCTQAATFGMPEGEDHDHNEPSQHQGLYCRIKRVAFLPLTAGELADGLSEDSKLGEMDVKGDIAAVAVQEPVGGVLFFDVSDPSKPRFLSRYVHAACALGDNCGAYVEMMEDGRSALLALQQTDLMPGLVTGYSGQGPGVAVIDLRDPAKPVLSQEYHTVSVQGIHTARSFVIKDGPAAGEYAFLIQNGVGTEITRVVDTPAGKQLVHLSNVPIADSTNITSTHDTFIQTDPTDGKTYLYTAGGFTYGFRVYDVSNPATPLPVANWDITPQCRNDWYAHTIDVTTFKGRRIVTMPAEAFDFGAQADAGEECGTASGNGDRPGPLWIVDATDFSKLATEQDSVEDIKAKSEAALITTWTNPAGRAAGQLTFSPHNQQIVGDKIFLSHYHGGIFVLDASAAFEGRKERPRELNWAVPYEPETRPTLESGTFPHSRGDFWDMVFYKGFIIAADIKGGLYSLRAEDVSQPGGSTAEPGCDDKAAPGSKWNATVSRKGVVIKGTAADAGCDGRIQRVLVAVALQKGSKCRFLSHRGKPGRVRSCAKPAYVTAKGTRSFALRIRGKLQRGRYRIAARAFDGAGNFEPLRYSRVRLR